jgi:uncharacterized protein YndB with AHSA1/START domain/effector-binding domain-containing protein
MSAASSDAGAAAAAAPSSAPAAGAGELGTIRESVEIAAPAESVWRVLTTPECMAQWGGCFLPGCVLRAPEGVEVGKPASWSMLGATGNDITLTKGTIGAADANKLLRVDFPASASGHPPNDMAESYALEPSADGKSCRLSITCGPMTPASVAMMQPGWPRVLQLIKVLSEGVRAPTGEELACPEMAGVAPSAPLRTAAIQCMLTKFEEIPGAMQKAIPELYAALAAQGIAPAGCLISHYMQEPALWNSATDPFFELRVSVPISADAKLVPEGRLIESSIPGCKVARLFYSGDYDGIVGGWGRLDQFIRDKKLVKTEKGMFWENYIRGPKDAKNPAMYVSQLNWALKDE